MRNVISASEYRVPRRRRCHGPCYVHSVVRVISHPRPRLASLVLRSRLGLGRAAAAAGLWSPHRIVGSSDARLAVRDKVQGLGLLG